MHACCVLHRRARVQPLTQSSALVAGLPVSGGNDDKAGDGNASGDKQEHEGLAFRHVARMPSGMVRVNPNSDELWG